MSGPGGAPSARSPIRGWWPLLLIAVVAVVAVAVVQHPRSPLVVPAPTTSVSSGPSTSTGSPPTKTPTRLVPLVTRAPGSAPVAVDLHRAVLGVAASWELFARADDSVVRIELAKGRVTRTGVPALASSGGVSFLVGPRQTVIRPFDFVPGYQVPDGAEAKLLSGALGVGGPALAGPDRDHLWAHADRNADAFVLTDWAGRPSAAPAAARAAAPADSSLLSAVPDGTGQILFFSAERGVFLVGVAGRSLLTGGTLDAIGARSMVVTQCDPDSACTTAVVDRKTSKRRVLPHATSVPSGPGLISPDERYAAVVTSINAASSARNLSLLNLDDGTRRELPQSLGVPDRSQMVFSPDARWLFVVTADARIAVVAVATGTISDLGIALPAIRQIAVRP